MRDRGKATLGTGRGPSPLTGNHAVVLALSPKTIAGGGSTMTSRIKLPGAKAEVASSVLLSFAAVLLASTLFLSGCNTAEGFGDDVEEAGDEVGDAID
jgi:predicted small secreted protein